MHTDTSTNCTLLGPVDCNSFYKWIPLNRWPVAISSEVLHFIYCAFLSVSVSPSFSYVHHIIHCVFTSLNMKELVVKCECDRGFVPQGWFCLMSKHQKKKNRKERRLWFITRILPLVSLFLWLAKGFICHTRTHPTSSAVIFFLVSY